MDIVQFLTVSIIMSQPKLDLIAARMKAEFRNDLKFRSGVKLLERAQNAVDTGQFKDYFVWYCSDDPDVVDTITMVPLDANS